MEFKAVGLQTRRPPLLPFVERRLVNRQMPLGLERRDGDQGLPQNKARELGVLTHGSSACSNLAIPCRYSKCPYLYMF
jgi:hypothetical protein